jgi:hypothetical protein
LFHAVGYVLIAVYSKKTNCHTGMGASLGGLPTERQYESLISLKRGVWGLSQVHKVFSGGVLMFHPR